MRKLLIIALLFASCGNDKLSDKAKNDIIEIQAQSTRLDEKVRANEKDLKYKMELNKAMSGRK